MANKAIGTVVFAMLACLSLQACIKSDGKQEAQAALDSQAWTNRQEQVLANTESAESSEMSETKPMADNLLYKEYSLGSPLMSEEILIDKERLDELHPESIVIFRNDKMFQTIPYEHADIHMVLPAAGTYYFAAVDKDGVVTEIKFVEGICREENVIFLDVQGTDFLTEKE